MRADVAAARRVCQFDRRYEGSSYSSIPGSCQELLPSPDRCMFTTDWPAWQPSTWFRYGKILFPLFSGQKIFWLQIYEIKRLAVKTLLYDYQTDRSVILEIIKRVPLSRVLSFPISCDYKFDYCIVILLRIIKRTPTKLITLKSAIWHELGYTLYFLLVSQLLPIRNILLLRTVNNCDSRLILSTWRSMLSRVIVTSEIIRRFSLPRVVDRVIPRLTLHNFGEGKMCGTSGEQ